MIERAPRLRRAIFGYSKRSVESCLNETKTTLRMDLKGQARLLEQKMNDLESQLAAGKSELQERDREVETARERIVELEAQTSEATAELGRCNDKVSSVESMVADLEGQLSAARDELRKRSTGSPGPSSNGPGEDDLVARFVTEELSTVLDSMVSDVVQQFRRSGEAQLREAEDMRSATRAEVDRLATWRQTAEPLIDSVRASIEGTKVKVADVPVRIGEALAPFTDAIGSLNERLGELAEVATAPPPAPPGPSGGSSDVGADAMPGDLGEEPRADRDRAVPDLPLPTKVAPWYQNLGADAESTDRDADDPGNGPVASETAEDDDDTQGFFR